MFSTRKELKQRAKASMEGTKPSYLIIGIIMMIAVNAESWMMAFFGPEMTLDEIMELPYEQMTQSLEQYYRMSLPLQLASIALALFVGVLTFGFMRYCLRLSRGEKEVPVDELVSGFRIFFKVIGLNLITGLFIVLWGLLFIIPGIVAAYRYRMAPLLLMDHPDWSVMDCIRESKRLMQGHKGDLFVLDLSFFGWLLLSSVVTMLAAIPVLDIWLTPYMQVTECHFYNELVGWGREGESNEAWWEN